jgi:chorismate-pyruvate lyase
LKSIDSTEIELDQLISLFYSQSEQQDLLGSFEACSSKELPPDYQRLLAHEHHMTVTVEAFHKSPIELQVLATHREGHSYSRKILLKRVSDGRVVLFGIVRIDLNVLEPDVRQAIESQQAPLGQVLIDHNVMRQVKLVALYKVQPGAELTDYFALIQATETIRSTPSELSTVPSPLFGRTSLIYCNGRPVIELLEIVAG